MAKNVPLKPLLITLYGYPGSGKTFFANELSQHLQAAHVQGDRIRYELFEKPTYSKQENATVTQLMDYMAEQFLNSGISVIYDTNAMRLGQRHALREMARKLKAVPIVVWLQIDIESAFDRVAHRDRRKQDDKLTMPLDRTTFDSLVANMQNPATTESYMVISGKHTFKTQYASFIKKMRDLRLVAIDETGKTIKPGLVNLVPNPSAGRVDMSRRNIFIR